MDKKTTINALRKKFTKNEVQYTDLSKKDHNCSMCKYFEKPDSCDLVAGIISPKGGCIKYEAKNG